MDEMRIINRVELRGSVAERPSFSHENRGEVFLTFPLEVLRLSGAVDRINIVARAELLEELEVTEARKLHVLGELRSFNNKSGEGSRLVITVFARELTFDDGEDINSVQLTGAICKPPNLRTTPMGREICDLMLAVNRRYGRSDYLPCIAWGLRAKEASEWPVGMNVSLDGRIQSRKYIKNLDGIPLEKTAFEVSIIDIGELE
jgi:single-strand DNA-binding protein